MVNGFNADACMFLAPMLTDENPQDFFPRFRDCWEEDGNIVIFTRVGGGNRGVGFGEEKLYEMPTFMKTYDDGFDPTYGCYVFGVPEEFKADFEAVKEGRFGDVSEALIARIEKCYPSIAIREKIAALVEKETE